MSTIRCNFWQSLKKFCTWSSEPPTLVPEAFFYSLLANFATRTAFYIFFLGTKRWEPRKESLWSRPLGTSLSCHQLLTVVSDWRTFLIALRVIWLDGLNIFGDGSGVSIFTFMDMYRELLLYQWILLPWKGKVFVVELAYNSIWCCKLRRSW